MTKHLHHIIPKHQGGTDDTSNLIELSIEEHAEAHRRLYEQYGHWEDFIAWQGLSGMMGKEEIIQAIQKEAGKKKIKIHGNPWEGIRGRFNWAENPDFHTKVVEAARSPEANKKRKETLQRIGHSRGEKNSQFGTMWITDGSSNRKIAKTSAIPDGWRRGRV